MNVVAWPKRCGQWSTSFMRCSTTTVCRASRESSSMRHKFRLQRFRPNGSRSEEKCKRNCPIGATLCRGACRRRLAGLDWPGESGPGRIVTTSGASGLRPAATNSPSLGCQRRRHHALLRRLPSAGSRPSSASVQRLATSCMACHVASVEL